MQIGFQELSHDMRGLRSAAIEAKSICISTFYRPKYIALPPRRHLFTKSRASSLNRPVQHSVLDGLADVDGAYDLGDFEVGDRAGDLEDARVGAGAQAQPPEGRFE